MNMVWLEVWLIIYAAVRAVAGDMHYGYKNG